MADFDIAEGIRKVFLAGVGAVATGAEKTQELVDDFIKKGELTVEQGKALNEELSHKVKEATTDGSDAILRTRLKTMTPEQRAAYAERVANISAEIDAEAAAAEAEDAVEDAADAVKDAVDDVAEAVEEVIEPDDAE